MKTPIDPNSKMYKNASAVVGKRFGNLVVTGIAGQKNGAPYVYCACDCGKTKHAVRLTSLTYNSTSSCGCMALGASATASRRKAQKYIGQTFGHLTITEILSREESMSRGTGVFCRVDCDCGTKGHITSLSRVVNGFTKSCGHCGASRRKSRKHLVPLLTQAQESVGKRFGRLVVTGVAGKKIPEGSHRSYLYVTCDCDCGKKGHLVPFRSLKYNKTQSCGCAHSSYNAFLEKNRKDVPAKPASPSSVAKEKKAPQKKKQDPRQEAIDRAQKLIGQRCGRLVVTGVAGYLSRKGSSRQYLYVLCDCDCGTKDHLIPAHSIREGATKSCGCLRTESYDRRRQVRKEKAKAALRDAIKSVKDAKKKPKSIYTTDPLTNNGYDLSAKRLFDYWEGLDKETVCLAWQSPEKFADWGIKNGFVNGRQLVRHDPQKPHNPINSYWR